jgi:hypothetical protein
MQIKRKMKIGDKLKTRVYAFFTSGSDSMKYRSKFIPARSPPMEVLQHTGNINNPQVGSQKRHSNTRHIPADDSPADRYRRLIPQRFGGRYIEVLIDT